MRSAPKSKNRAHTGSMEIRAIWSYIDLTWRSNSVTWSAPNAFVDAATYSWGTPSTMSTNQTGVAFRGWSAITWKLR